jgi:hypothetical protein
MSSCLIDYPLAGRLFPSAFKLLSRLRDLGPTVIPSDGDFILRPRSFTGKSNRRAFRYYIHKEEVSR